MTEVREGVSTLGNWSLAYNHEMKQIFLPKSLQRIGERAIYNCNGLTEITIPQGVTSIGDEALGICYGLENILVDSKNTAYGSRDGILTNKAGTIILQCPIKKTLGSYTVPSGVTSIGNGAFRGCSLTDVVIPGSVVSIGDLAFFDCKNLTGVTIQNGVTSIGNQAFSCCDKLTSVTIPDSVTSIGFYAFWSSPGLLDENGLFISNGMVICVDQNLVSVVIPSGVTKIYDYAFAHCSNLTSVTIPSGVTSIGEYAFGWCESLTGVTITDSVTSIGENAFSFCFAMTDLTVASGNPSFVSRDNVLFSKDGKKLIRYASGKENQSYSIPSGVTTICAGAFDIAGYLTEITIPSSVTSIGAGAFMYCMNMGDVTFEGNAPKIGEDAFSDVTAVIHYPANNKTWTASVRQNYGGTLTWAEGDTIVIPPLRPRPHRRRSLPERHLPDHRPPKQQLHRHRGQRLHRLHRAEIRLHPQRKLHHCG